MVAFPSSGDQDTKDNLCCSFQKSSTEGSNRVELVSYYEDLNGRNFPKHSTLNELGSWKMSKIIPADTDMILFIKNEGETTKGAQFYLSCRVCRTLNTCTTEFLVQQISQSNTVH
jgi:hypothetical protein